jgi:uncharacterized membrane protein
MKVNFAVLISDTISTAFKNKQTWLYSILLSSIIFNVLFLVVNLILYFNSTIFSKLQPERIIEYQRALLDFISTMDDVSMLSLILFLQFFLILILFFAVTNLITFFIGLGGVLYSIRKAYSNTTNSIYDSCFFARQNWFSLFKIWTIGISSLTIFNTILYSISYQIGNIYMWAVSIILFILSAVLFLLLSIYWNYYILFQDFTPTEAIEISVKAIVNNFVDNILYLLLGGILKSFLIVFSSFFFTYLVLDPVIQITSSIIQNLTSNLTIESVLIGGLLCFTLLNFSSVITSVSLYFSNSFNLIFNEEIFGKTTNEDSYVS